VVSSNGQTAYFGAGRANCVVVLKLATLAVEDTIRVGQRPWGVALTADGKMLFTADGRSNAVSEIDVAHRRVVRHIAVGDHPYAVAIVASR
jgi:YVTN family beta-propeller protein